MANLDLIRELATETPSKIVMLIMDGLGGLPDPETGRTELETASTPNLDALAKRSSCGLSDPVSPGITPGSGPGHLALFGYDPQRYLIGRGVLEAVGIDFPLGPDDVAARGNFCSVDESGVLTDRRAGRIPTEKCAELVSKLQGMRLSGAEALVEPVQDYRFVLVLRGKGLSDALTETDPQREGLTPPPVRALAPEAGATAGLANDFIATAAQRLAAERPANMVMLRGFSKVPLLPSMAEIYRLRAAAVAVYPMYRGIAKLVGMEGLPTGRTLEEQIATLEANWDRFDFFFVHFKYTDSAGEDGDFARKAKVIEDVDRALPRISALGPDVLVVSGDHSTPAALKGHSWHPVPLLIHSRWCRLNPRASFSEEGCAAGALGRIPATEIMPIAMANALKLAKYGA